jgi:metallophosphoesterase (TIGR00282 family)
MKKIYKFLFLGDIFGKTGRKILSEHLFEIKKENEIDFTIANGENLAHGSGINIKGFHQICEAGVDVVTSGNHVFHQKQVMELLDDTDNLLIPANYPMGVPGKRYGVFNVKDLNVLIINIHGIVLINKGFNPPFRVVENILTEYKNFDGPIFIDFHGEATSEKRAFAMYFDGKVTGIVGTHTHIQTADERIQPKGTAYITDIGMCGPYNSVIGIKLESVIDQFLYELPTKFEVASSQPSIQGVIMTYDSEKKCVNSIERLLKIY